MRGPWCRRPPAVNLELAAQRRHAIRQPAQPGPAARVGAAGAVVGDPQVQVPIDMGEVDLRLGGTRVALRVGERLGDGEVGRRLHQSAAAGRPGRWTSTGRPARRARPPTAAPSPSSSRMAGWMPRASSRSSRMASFELGCGRFQARAHDGIVCRRPQPPRPVAGRASPPPAAAAPRRGGRAPAVAAPPRSADTIRVRDSVTTLELLLELGLAGARSRAPAAGRGSRPPPAPAGRAAPGRERVPPLAARVAHEGDVPRLFPPGSIATVPSSATQPPSAAGRSSCSDGSPRARRSASPAVLPPG